MNTHDIDRELQERFQRDAALPAGVQERLEHTYDDIRQSGREKEVSPVKQHSRKRRVRTVIALAATVAVLSAAALGAGLSHSSFFQSVFGDSLPGREAEEHVDYPGATPYTYPASDRVAVDESQAEELIGDNVADVDSSVELDNGCTYTALSYVKDENGISCLTFTVENPNGLEDILGIWPGNANEAHFLSDPSNLGLFHPPYFRTVSGVQLDGYIFVDTSATTDTLATLIAYITPFEPVSDPDDDLVIAFSHCDQTLTIPATSAVVAAATFTYGDATASVSPLGIVLSSPSWDIAITSAETNSEYIIHELYLEYADGSEYVVDSDVNHICNRTCGSVSQDCTYHFECFNRLVDPSSVTSVIVNDMTLTG